MKKLFVLAAALIPLTGCLVIERARMTVDLAAMTGELRFLNIGTDDASKANNDFAELINNYVRGTQVNTDHPGWNIVSKELYEEQGQLNGVIKFNFRRLEDVRVYKHDKKSPYFHCVNSGETILSSNGIATPGIDGCIALEKKAKTLEVEVKKGDIGGGRSLLAEYQGWDGGAVQGSTDDPYGLNGLGQSLEGLGNLFGGEEGQGGLGSVAAIATPWSSMGLPSDGTMLFSNENVYSVAHTGNGKEIVGKYDMAFRSAGYQITTPVTESAGIWTAVYSKGAQTLSLSAVPVDGKLNVSLSLL